MFIQYAIEPFQGSEFVMALHPELHSGLFTLNHSVVSLGQRLGMDSTDPMSLPHCGHRPFAGANPLRISTQQLNNSTVKQLNN
jgi:hypothetical protein